VLADDEMRTIVVPRVRGDDEASWAVRPRYWRDKRVLLGGSDAGAHLDLLASFTYFTNMLSESVRRRQLIGLEEAIHLMVDRPARLYGLTGRGRLVEGSCADVVIFDEATVGPDAITTRHDLPAGAPRLYAAAHGIERVLVNGHEVVANGEYNGERPGTLLRSGRDTETRSLKAGR
jgi:N-acyl-D-aspartate/D-glutamate deacylase